MIYVRSVVLGLTSFILWNLLMNLQNKEDIQTTDLQSLHPKYFHPFKNIQNVWWPGPSGDILNINYNNCVIISGNNNRPHADQGVSDGRGWAHKGLPGLIFSND